MPVEVLYVILLVAAVSALTVVVTVYDKVAAKKLPRNRVPEKVLFLLALLGGAAAEYITMKIIRHKTLHKKFMIGLPVIIALHVILIVLWAFVL